MIRKFAITAFTISVLVGCASVPMESEQTAQQAKEFNPPADGNAGLYIYRDSSMGSALKKDIWVDNECVGESAAKVFFYKEVKGDAEHTISTESEFSPNDLVLTTESGKHYFIRQYIKMGLAVGGANLELMDEKEGKQDIMDLDMAIQGTCSGPRE